MLVVKVDKTVIRGAIDRYGHKHQMIVAIEEMSELTKELTKTLRGEQRREAVIEELADVLICLLQVAQMFNISNKELNHMIAAKAERLDRRMKEE